MAHRHVWLTDIHLNFVHDGRVQRLIEEILELQPDGVLIGGDIAEAPGLLAHLEHLESELALPIRFVLGNHDYYRGSIAAVREGVRQLSAERERLDWLPESGVVEIAPGVALIGHGGWGDARLGNWESSPVTPRMTDHHLIRELKDRPTSELITELRLLGDDAATRLDRALTQALETFSRVLVLTHVPPFAEAAWHEGQVSSPDWLPHFACQATGDVLRRALEGRSDRQAVVLCGHTHSSGRAAILPNLRVVTGRAVYGEPVVESVIDLERLFD